MARTCYIHLGMPKTGSTSIQKTLLGYRDERVIYGGLQNHNHSNYLTFLFSDRASEIVTPKPAKVRFLYNLQKSKLVYDSEVNGRSDLILSSENISARLNEVELSEMHASLRKHFDRIRILMYVRPVKGYAASVFQQQLKAGLRKFEIPDPVYRKRTENVIKAFGRENIEFRLFDRKTLLNGDVVDDFLSFVNIDSAQIKHVVVNESFSLEACSIVFLNNILNNALAPPLRSSTPFQKERHRLAVATALGSFGTGKLGFTDSIIDGYVARNAKDIDYMTALTGFDLIGTKTVVEEPVRSAEHLFGVAYRHLPEALQILQEKDRKSAKSRPIRRGKLTAKPPSRIRNLFRTAKRRVLRVLTPQPKR